MKKVLVIIAVGVIALATLEFGSSYVLFRYYAYSRSAFRPVGSATVELIGRSLLRLRGEHKNLEASIDHGPMFDSDPLLGFRLLPGDFQITQRIDGLVHQFHMRVNERGERAVSYAPVAASPRIFIAADSSIFGWGLDDEQTVPWLLQTRVQNYRVVNLSLTSNSTVQTLLRLRRVEPSLTEDDIAVLVYHPVTNDFNVAASNMLDALAVGYEIQLGNVENIRRMRIPFGALDAGGALDIRRFDMACRFAERGLPCLHPDPSPAAAREVTKRAFEQVLAMNPGRTLVVFMSGEDDDPVVAYLRAKNVEIVDVRTKPGDPDADDLVPTDSHSGPYWHHAVYRSLLGALIRDGLVDQAYP